MKSWSRNCRCLPLKQRAQSHTCAFWTWIMMPAQEGWKFKRICQMFLIYLIYASRSQNWHKFPLNHAPQKCSIKAWKKFIWEELIQIFLNRNYQMSRIHVKAYYFELRQRRTNAGASSLITWIASGSFSWGVFQDISLDLNNQTTLSWDGKERGRIIKSIAV